MIDESLSLSHMPARGDGSVACAGGSDEDDHAVEGHGDRKNLA